MKARLQDYLACPECGTPNLDLKVFREEGEEIIEAELDCTACGRCYWVIEGVPRMLPDALRATVRQYHPEFFARHGIQADQKPSGDDVARTLAFFTRQRVELFEENAVPEVLARFEQTLNLRIPEARSFRGKFGLDAGCGEGRYCYTLARYGAEIVGMDLGNSVDWAFKRNRGNPSVHIVQGSIFQPPFRPGVFDFVMSIGVIHHLTEPRRGFAALAPLLHAGGSIHIWVYGLENMSFVYRVSHLTPLRTITRRLPPRGTYLLSVPLALTLQLFVFLPVNIARRFPKIRQRVDQQLLDVAALPSLHKVAEVHDRIGAPVTHFLTREELQDWYREAGLEEIQIVLTPGGRGWSITGSAPDVSHAVRHATPAS